MKRKAVLLLLVSTVAAAQSVEIKPGNNGFVLVPNVSALGSCAAADKGRIVFYGQDNSLRMCNGSSWINLSTVGGFGLPYSGSNSSDLPLLSIVKTNQASAQPAISGNVNSANTGSAVQGTASHSSPSAQTAGLKGLNSSMNHNGYGVYGVHAGSGIGVFGETTDPVNGGIGVKGSNAGKGDGVYGESLGGRGVAGFSAGGSNANNVGVYGLAYGVNSRGVEGYSENGYGFGILGRSEKGIGVVGHALNFHSNNGVGGHFSNEKPDGYALVTGLGKVGIGVETPVAKLDIRGTGATSHFYHGEGEDIIIRGGKTHSKILLNDLGLGYIGIGTNNPQSLLHVNGNVTIGGITASNGYNAVVVNSVGTLEGVAVSAFSARNLTSNIPIPNSTDFVFPFNSEDYDTFGSYNNATYEFTAPTNGIYHFDGIITFGVINSAYATSMLQISLQVNSVTEAAVNALCTVGGYRTLTLSQDLKLSVGQKVRLRAYQNSGNAISLIGYHHSKFTGRLVSRL